jgi:hypothetical protein
MDKYTIHPVDEEVDGLMRGMGLTGNKEDGYVLDEDQLMLFLETMDDADVEDQEEFDFDGEEDI